MESRLRSLKQRGWLLLPDQSNEYLPLLAELGNADRDVYYHPAYLSATARHFGGQLYVAVFRGSSGVYLHPILVRPLPEEYAATCHAFYDAQTPYGYGGPISNMDSQEMPEAEKAFEEICKEVGIVCLFVRFNPVIGNERKCGGFYGAWVDRETVLLNIAQTDQKLLNAQRSAHKYMIRKALRLGVVVRRAGEGELEKFAGMYISRMRSLGAESSYEFSLSYFQELSAGLQDGFICLLAYHRDLVCGGAIYLAGSAVLHYHLATATEEGRDLGVSNLLVYRMMVEGRDRGYRQLHLGGGRTASVDDSLFRFKAGFGGGRAPFHLGKRVFLPVSYQSLCQEWCSRHKVPESEKPGYFQFYRLNPPPTHGQLDEETDITG